MDFIPYIESSVRSDIKLNIVDAVLLSPSTAETWKWVFTDPNGFVRSRCLKPLPFGEMARDLLANMSTALANSPEHRRIVLSAVVIN